MKVLIACEERRKEAYSCDIQDPSGGHLCGAPCGCCDG